MKLSYTFSLNQITLQEIFMEILGIIFGWMIEDWVNDIEPIVCA